MQNSSKQSIGFKRNLHFDGSFYVDIDLRDNLEKKSGVASGTPGLALPSDLQQFCN